jgi:phosphoglycerate dehydrogenase-like enzyme
MKPTSLLVNVSRGPIVNESDLIAALKSGRPAHAALDVYDREPLPTDHPFRRMDNVTIAPHLGYVNDETYRVFHADQIENVEAWLAGKPIRVMNAEHLKATGAK